MKNLQTIRSVTERYNNLQGLALLPWLILLMLIFINGAIFKIQADNTILLFAGYLAAIISQDQICKWYSRQFGLVQAGRKKRVTDGFLTLGMALVASLALIVDAQLKPPVHLFSMTLAIMAAGLSLSTPLLAFLRWLALVLVIIGFLPLLSFDNFWRNNPFIIPTLVITAVAVAAVYSHFLLVRLLGPVEDEA